MEGVALAGAVFPDGLPEGGSDFNDLVQHSGAAEVARQVRAFLETNGEALFTWHHRGVDDHKPNTPLRAGFKILMGGDGEPIKADSASDYLERTSGASLERRETTVDYMILRERWREICKGFDHSAVATLLRQRGHLVHEKDRLMNKRRLPGMGLTAYYHVKASIFSDAL